MSFPRPRSWVQWFRRITQAVFLGLFLWLLFEARVKEKAEPGPLLDVFFSFDPLVLLATSLATRTLVGLSLLALVTVGVTLVLGRVFCGWVCPLGTVHHFFGWLGGKLKRRDGTPRPDGWSPWQRSKYFLLVGLLAMALFGLHWIGVFDPLSLLYRTVTTTVLPASQYAVEDSTTSIYQADPKFGSFRVTSVSEPVYRFFRDHVFLAERQTFNAGMVILLLFVLIVALNFVRNRFWCRYVCPLGALLGVCAKRPVMRLNNEESQCNNCGRCTMACPAGADPEKAGRWRATECYECWNCVASCNFKAVDFTFASPLRKPTEAKLDLSKRALLATGIGGVGALLAFRLDPQAQARTFNPDLVRPPGARPEREFLQRCIQCGLCMKACPTNVIQPAAFEAGLEGLWTPIMEPRVGYCEYECNLCGQVCPTEALQPLSVEEKKKVKLGLASFDVARCLPYAYGRECIVCEEHCPTSPKAIYTVPTQVALRGGGTKTLKQPRVEPDLCIGCGICENVCVFKDRAAIRVTSANETRHPDNQPVLPGLSGTGSTEYGSEEPPAESGASDPYGG